MPALRMPVNRGVVTSKSAEGLAPGELVPGTGAYYKLGDTDRIHKLNGRSTYGDTASVSAVRSLYLAQFSNGTDKVLALSGTSVKSATAGATGTFTNLITGLSASGDLHGFFMGGRHYLVDGSMAMRGYESDGTVFLAGMVAPSTAPVVTPAAVTPAVSKPAAVTTGIVAGSPLWANLANATDTEAAEPVTFASMTMDSVITQNDISFSAWANDSATGRVFQLVWEVAGLQGGVGDGGTGGSGGGSAGGGGSVSAGFNVTVEIHLSTDGGLNYTKVMDYGGITAAISKQLFQTQVSVNSNLIFGFLRPIYNSGLSPATVRVYEVDIAEALVANFSTNAGFRYCVTEFDSTRQDESPQGPNSPIVTMATQNVTSFLLPTAAKNARATHWRIYRTPDGGAIPHQYGLVGQVPITDMPLTDTVFTDVFFIPFDTQPFPLLPLITVQSDNGGELRFPQNTPPPVMVHLNSYAGSAVGVGADGGVYYSIRGFPQKWPEPYVLTDFPYQQEDVPLATATIGNTLIIAASEIIMAREGLPRVEDGAILRSPTRAISGQPGCVGRKALTVYSVDGFPRFSWVSRYGIHETADGHSADLISRNMDWDALFPDTSVLDTAVLGFNVRLRLLVFAYDSDGDGVNDRFWTLHTAVEHRGRDGLPLWTGPHYGKIVSMESGQVSGIHRVYSGHGSNGKVYLEDNGNVDTSEAYVTGSTQWPFIVEIGHAYDEQNRQRVYAATALVRHTDAGSGQTATVLWTSGLDDDRTTQTSSEDISLDGAGAETILLALGGDWHSFKITHTGAAAFKMDAINAEIYPMERTGHIGTY